MAAHFLTLSKARTLSLASVFRLSEAEAETLFRSLRWHETGGEAVCPECGCLDAYEFRRKTGALQFECKGCRKQYSITSGTLFASHKAPLRAYLACIAVACNEVKGKSALALSRDLGMSYRRAWLLADELGRLFKRPILNTAAGGARGGGAALTDFGRALLAAYRRIEDRAAEAARAELIAFESDLDDV